MPQGGYRKPPARLVVMTLLVFCVYVICNGGNKKNQRAENHSPNLSPHQRSYDLFVHLSPPFFVSFFPIIQRKIGFVKKGEKNCSTDAAKRCTQATKTRTRALVLDVFRSFSVSFCLAVFLDNKRATWDNWLKCRVNIGRGRRPRRPKNKGLQNT